MRGGRANLCVLREEVLFLLLSSGKSAACWRVDPQLQQRDRALVAPPRFLLLKSALICCLWRSAVATATVQPPPAEHGRDRRVHRAGLTSVPCLDSAAFASWRIFSRYIWAARLLYLALVSLVEQPCWRKNAVCRQEVRAALATPPADHRQRPG